jgi:formamidopyrimidine-DNA glycosylase
MPELPEVETIKLGLQKYLIGHKIESVDVRYRKIFSGDETLLKDAVIQDVRRIGKGLILSFNKGYSLAIHIKMTGQIIYRGKETKNMPLSLKIGTLPSKHTHVIFYLDDDAVLFYNDIRKFGWLKVVKSEDVTTLGFFRDMGPEPLGGLTLGELKRRLSKVNAPVKVFLMDQRQIGGVGNIYSNDALYKAGIDPRRKAKSLTGTEAERLFDAVCAVLKRSISLGAASEVNFVNALGQEGNYQKERLVYNREGESCSRCGNSIRKIRLGGRGTYLCQYCQK